MNNWFETMEAWRGLVALMVGIARGERLPLGNLERITDRVNHHPDVFATVVEGFNSIIGQIKRIDADRVMTVGDPLNLLYPATARLHLALQWPRAEFLTVNRLVSWLLDTPELVGVMTVDLGTKIRNLAHRDTLPADQWIGSLSVSSSLAAELLGCVGHIYERGMLRYWGVTNRYIDITKLDKDYILHVADEAVLTRAVMHKETDWLMWQLFRTPTGSQETGGIGWISDKLEADFRQRYATYKAQQQLETE